MVPEDPDLPAWVRRLGRRPEEIIPLASGRPPGHAPPPPRDPPKCGILIIDKPAGQTSHDVVQAVRRASGVRRVGHAGTLDPPATGVLVVCLESATRVIPEIQEGRKAYRARLRLGQETTTYDATGEVVAEHDPTAVTDVAVRAALPAFRGPIWQVPPMVSAVKHHGRRLYELARLGLEVDRQPRPVTIHALELVEWSPPELVLEMVVSKGTYVRSLAHDLGAALGVGAVVTALERLAVGRFRLEQAERLPRVVESFLEGWWPMLLLPLDSALLDYAALVVDAPTEAAMRQGRRFEAPAPAVPPTPLVRVYNPEGGLVGLARWDEVTGHWQPDRVFPKTP
jgi:tRNA pseudouridine55 synthase